MHHAELQRVGDLLEGGDVTPRNLVTTDLVPRGHVDGPHHGFEFGELELLPASVRIKIGMAGVAMIQQLEAETV